MVGGDAGRWTGACGASAGSQGRERRTMSCELTLVFRKAETFSKIRARSELAPPAARPSPRRRRRAFEARKRSRRCSSSRRCPGDDAPRAAGRAPSASPPSPALFACPVCAANGLLTLHHERSTAGTAKPLRRHSTGSIFSRSQSPHVTGSAAAGASRSPCVASHASKRPSTSGSASAPSTSACVIDVSSVQKRVSVGRSVGRTSARNSSTLVSVAASTSTAGNSMISCTQLRASFSHVASKSITRK